PGRQLEPAKEKDTFRGYLRPGRRGVGTRNFVVLLGTSSLSASFCRTLEAQAQEWRRAFPNVDGVVAVTHTEGGTPHSPNNRDLLLRSLAGFLVHANVGAVIAVERGGEVISNAVLREFMEANHYPLGDVPHEFFNLGAGFQEELKRGGESVRRLLTQANATARTPQPASTLKIALQCGGSDAFSGISGNPLAGDVARRVILQGGAANLAETDELIGAEPYVLSNVRDAQTAQTFLKMVERFKERAAWHGHSAEGNPSGGNQYRGLYNIALKSIGAARKKPPEVRLDHVIEYSQPMAEGGYYFMDSPGNDLESIAGQVGSGCNMILFTTGNGSITNFPFVPTLKIVTTTGRWQMLAKEMDVNAGRYNDGLSMDALGEETYRLTLDVASGKLSLGESAGHSQVSIWRDWAQTDGSHLQALQNHPAPAGKSLTLPPSPAPAKDSTFHALRSKRGVATRQLGLVVPTSICSAQVARVLADRLNANIGKYTGVDRFVALVHTEGCGAAPGYSTELFLRTVHGHIVHPAVRRALLLEHGCEQTHNDAMRQYLSKQGVPLGDLGWASVQLDGGMETVMAKAERWFAEHLNDAGPESVNAGLESLRLGLTATGVLEDAPARALALLGRQIVAAGGLVVLPQNAALIKSRAFLSALLGQADEPAPTLGYGEAASGSGLHVMETPTSHGVETFTGLAATGVEVMLAH
ncbi:MAG: UxaA family hydrolase, partial [Deltaproteobacteria bacterium]|nr:UxaA family hydrolase [Deltaproteobacteria bacterium]